MNCYSERWLAEENSIDHDAQDMGFSGVMSNNTELLQRLYDRFNARDMEAVLATMHQDVVWANGLDGGYVYGRDGVRAYWTRQWATMDPRAEPISFSIGEAATVQVLVHLTAHDLTGKLLFDTRAVHVFQIEDGLVRRFDIRTGSGNWC